MITTLSAMAPIFLIIATGYLLFKTKVADESVWSAVEHICFYLLFPFLIIIVTVSDARTRASADVPGRKNRTILDELFV